MNIVQAEENLKKITSKISKDTFIYDLLLAYNFKKATISKLQKGSLNKAKSENEVLLPKKLYFVPTTKKDLDGTFDRVKKDSSILKQEPRFIIVTDYQSIKAYDTKMGETLDIDIKSLPKHPDFFLPWAGIEKKVFQGENPADVKAAEKLARAFDLIRLDNAKFDEKNRHDLNVFLTRVLFCFFAEDTDIFEKGLFTNSIASHTKGDGSDLSDYLKALFNVLNEKSRKGHPDYLKQFPYVNGGLFAEEYLIPKFSKRSRATLVELGDLDWAQINPDIFGSMIQAVVHPNQRAGLGMHYTSVTNIMKVIEPLFLTELYEEFDKAKNSKPRLKKLLERISKIKIFDPACGSGNFLIIAYKELRTLEMKILKALGEIPMSGISLSNFYGIEIDDFAHEVAKLSLWLAEHQMDVVFNREFGNVKPSLPLKDSGNIICQNALQVNWINFCYRTPEDEVYIFGNPPYLGFKQQTKTHKEDIKTVFGNTIKLDYIACWFRKASDYILGHNGCLFAFVSTDSVCQGEQVSLLWQPILRNDDLEINFCHDSFKWDNNAKGKAMVSCVIIGVRNRSEKAKKMYFGNYVQIVKNINPYLAPTKTIFIFKRREPIANIPEMTLGDMAKDGGGLFLSEAEKNYLLSQDSRAGKYIKRIVGADEFISGNYRWCIWCDENNYKDAEKIPFIKERFEKVSESRLQSSKVETQEFANKPYRFVEVRYRPESKLLVPTVSSERRRYIPIGFFDVDDVVNAPNNTIYSPEVYIFGIIQSHIHQVWVRATSGKLENRIRYSVSLCYNNFPLPNLSNEVKTSIKESVFEILRIREKYVEKSIADLYDPATMPKDLSDAHAILDSKVDRCFKKDGFQNDSERLAVLFEEYEKMIGAYEKFN